MGSIADALVPAPEHKRKRLVDEYASAKRTFSVPSPMASYSYRRRNALRFELVSLASGINNNINNTSSSSSSSSGTQHQHAPPQTQTHQTEPQPQQSPHLLHLHQQQQQQLEDAAIPASSQLTLVPSASASVAAVVPAVVVVPPPPPMAVDDIVDPVPSLATPSSTDSIMSLDLSSSIAAPTSDVSSDDVPTPPLVDNAVNERRSTRNVSPRKQSTGQRGRPPSSTSARARRQQAVSTN